MKLKKLNQPQIGQLIFDLRKTYDYTQQEFSIIIGVSNATLNRWENGYSQPSNMAISAISRKLLELGEYGVDLMKKYGVDKDE